MDKILRVLEINSAPRGFDSDFAEDVITSNQFVVVVKEIREALVREDEHCSDHVPMICAFLNCDCDDCTKGKKEITKRMIEEYFESKYILAEERGMCSWVKKDMLIWLNKEEK